METRLTPHQVSPNEFGEVGWSRIPRLSSAVKCFKDVYTVWLFMLLGKEEYMSCTASFLKKIVRKTNELNPPKPGLVG